MNRKLINYILCPHCNSRSWEFDGYSTEIRYIDGVTSCENNHRFNICQDILRFDKESSKEEMIFLDHELTGYPKEVSETDRIDFLNAVEKALDELQLSDDTIHIYGNPILFFRYIPKFDNLFIVVDEDEGVLRQVQNLTVQKRMFPNSGFIRAKKRINVEVGQTIQFLGGTELRSSNEGDIVFSFSRAGDSSEVLWDNGDLFLTKKMI